MPSMEIELNPVSHITVDAIGKPGERVFYLQAKKDDQVVTLLVEKVQIQTLAIGVEQFFTELAAKFPDLPLAEVKYREAVMHIKPPVDPLFRAGEMGLAYDDDLDRICLVVHEILLENKTADEVAVARFWCTRTQLRSLIHWGLEVANRGRQICPQCGEPMDPSGHFCPKKNGHGRK